MAEKRNVHSYKVTDKVYRKAMRRAKKEPKTLSERIEEFVINYADNKEISYDGMALYKYGGLSFNTIVHSDVPIIKPTKSAKK